MTVVPKQKGSARIDDVPEPPVSDGPVLVETIAIGLCGTDFEIVQGAYGWPPPGEGRLVLGHESLGRVVEAPAGSGFEPGDRVVGIVRRPDERYRIRPEHLVAVSATLGTAAFSSSRRGWWPRSGSTSSASVSARGGLRRASS